MQQLYPTTSLNPAEAAASEVLASVPPLIWFIRATIRQHRQGLSLPQFRALVFLSAQPQANLSLVADNLSASLPTASRVIAGLVDKGLVVRHSCDGDRRQLALQTTARGRAVIDHAWKTARDKIQARLSPLTDSQRGSIADALRLLQSIFGSLDCPQMLVDDDAVLPRDAVDAAPVACLKRHNSSASAPK